MKRLCCLALSLLLLWGCTAAPDRTTAPETTIPETTVPETTVPETTVPAPTAAPRLKAGYYLLPLEEYDPVVMYLELKEDGTGLLSAMGSTVSLTWGPVGVNAEGLTGAPTAEGMRFPTNAEPAYDFVYSETLPEEYQLPQVQPGLYAVSSVGLDGNVSFYGVIDPENGYLDLLPDGTGSLNFGEETYSLTWESGMLELESGAVLSCFYTDLEISGEAPMVTVYNFGAESDINADSIIFRLIEAYEGE